jgi:hypothetical protein
MSHACDLLTPLALGMRLGVDLEALRSTFPGHPCLSEAAFGGWRDERLGRSVR